MNVAISDELLTGLDLKGHEVRLELAIGLYTDRRVTLGRAAAIAGMAQAEFLQALGKRRIPVHYDVGDFRADMQTIDQAQSA